jgi:hypothetical protein
MPKHLTTRNSAQDEVPPVTVIGNGLEWTTWQVAQAWPVGSIFAERDHKQKEFDKKYKFCLKKAETILDKESSFMLFERPRFTQKEAQQ